MEKIYFKQLKRRTKIPVKSLAKINIWLTLALTLFALTFTMVLRDSNGFQLILLITLMSFFTILLVSFFNLFLAILTEHLYKHTPHYKIMFVLISYGLNLILGYLLILNYTRVTHTSINFEQSIFAFILISLTNSLILVLQNFVLVEHAKGITEIENALLKAKQTETAYQLLRQQIHPHFLFNALNILKSLYKIRPKEGEVYLIRLSNFLRASVTINNTNVIPVKDEIELCEDYLEMQLIRFGTGLIYTIDISEETYNSKYIPSFSMQPLLENAIKHNEITVESPLIIKIMEENSYIRVTNNIQQKKSTEPSTGSGLANLSDRYQLLSNEPITIDKSNELFTVGIKILDHEDSNNRR